MCIIYILFSFSYFHIDRYMFFIFRKTTSKRFIEILKDQSILSLRPYQNRWRWKWNLQLCHYENGLVSVRVHGGPGPKTIKVFRRRWTWTQNGFVTSVLIPDPELLGKRWNRTRNQNQNHI